MSLQHLTLQQILIVYYLYIFVYIYLYTSNIKRQRNLKTQNTSLLIISKVRPSECREVMNLIYLLYLLFDTTDAFWDFGTTTPFPDRRDTMARTSFFRWQKTEFESMHFWYPRFDWVDIRNRRRLNVIAGISIDFTPLSTATIMNRRTLITSANFLDPHLHRQRDLRIWTLGRAGHYNTPYRYRVWRAMRIFPKSNNPEHQHGPTGTHCPRHDVAVIISLDQMYVYYTKPSHYQYPYKALLTGAHDILEENLLMAGSGFEYLQHVYENYKIFYAVPKRSDIVDCSKYLPKWWGKFICIKNSKRFPGVQNGGALLSGDKLVGLGCFEIRYNEDRLLVFTDLRYYVHWIYKYVDIYPGQYYEYAYPQWSVGLGVFYDGGGNYPYIPAWQIMRDLFPLG